MTQKTIALVGAGPALGLSLARRFGREGYNIALIARNRTKLDAMLSELRADGASAEVFVADVTRSETVKVALTAAEARFGAIDIVEYSPVVIPASMEDFAPLGVTAMTLERVQKEFATITLGAIATVQHVLPAMQARGNGAIVITTGISSIGYMPMVGAWGIAGAAARNYARTLNVALRDTGVFVGTVCLGVQVRKGDEHGDPDKLAEIYFDFTERRDRPELILNHMPPGMATFD